MPQGSRNAHKFNRFKDFFTHIDWLLDTSHELQDHSLCKCKKAPPPPKVPERSANEGATDAENSARKRKRTDTGELDNGMQKRLKDAHTPTQAEIDEESKQYAKEMMATDQDRRKDLRGKRLFRKDIVYISVCDELILSPPQAKANWCGSSWRGNWIDLRNSMRK